LRQKFHDPAQLKAKPHIARISSRRDGSHMICVCPTVMSTGPQVYMRFAAELADCGIGVSALVPPGFDFDEALPATRAALVRSLADSVEDYVGDSEFSLAGYSSGGVVAYELAKELQARGMAPIAAVLLDTYSLNFNDDRGQFDGQKLQDELNARLVEYVRSSGLGMLSERITAQIWTFGLLRDWRPEGLSVPSLYVRSAQPLAGEGNELRDEVISMMTSVVAVPGDHFNILEPEHVGLTARVVNDWLRNLP
jgi:pimaricinolide synthase PimS1